MNIKEILNSVSEAIIKYKTINNKRKTHKILFEYKNNKIMVFFDVNFVYIMKNDKVIYKYSNNTKQAEIIDYNELSEDIVNEIEKIIYDYIYSNTG